MSLDFIGAPLGLGHTASLLTVFGANVGYLSGVFVVGWIALRALSLLLGLSTVGITLVAVTFFAGYSMVAGPVGASATPLVFVEPMRTIPLMILALVAAILAGFWGETQDRRPDQDFTAMTRGCLRVSVLAFAGTALLWLLIYRTREAIGGVGVAALVAAVVVTALAWRLTSRRSGAFAALTLLALHALTAGIGWAGYQSQIRYAPPPVLGAENRPPIILLTLDTLRADAVLGPAGRRPGTPSIDSLAADSIVFERAISGGPWTLPGFTSMLSGTSPLVHGLGLEGDYFLPDDLPTLAEILGAEGYAPVALGSNPWMRSCGMASRFDWDFWHPRYGVGLSQGSEMLQAYTRLYNGQPYTPQLIDHAVELLEREHEAPFFLWLHSFDPHTPYSAPREYLDLSEMDEKIGPELDNDEATALATRSALDRAGRRWVRKLYEAEVRFVDDQVGRVLQALRASGLYDEALIIFASDHGEELWEHEGFEHGHTLYPELLHVPLMIKLPGSSEGRTVDTFAATQAVVPTILDLLGVDYDRALFSSRSLRPLWEDPGAVEPEPIVSGGVHYLDDWIGVIFEGRYQYLHRRHADEVELYDQIGRAHV